MLGVCPRCDRALVVVSWRDIEVDICPRCRGVWLDAGELEELLARSGADPADPLISFQSAPGDAHVGADRRLLCPRCDAHLREITTGTSGLPASAMPAAVPDRANRDVLIVDRCPRGHGLWFDTGELQALMKFCLNRCGNTGTLEALGAFFEPAEEM